MRRATITIPDELEASLDLYARRQEVAPALTAVVQAALTEYLSRRGYLAGREFRSPSEPLRITPLRESDGRGEADVSVAHDRYLAGD